jgi:hypothetical protein
MLVRVRDPHPARMTIELSGTEQNPATRALRAPRHYLALNSLVNIIKHYTATADSDSGIMRRVKPKNDPKCNLFSCI